MHSHIIVSGDTNSNVPKYKMNISQDEIQFFFSRYSIFWHSFVLENLRPSENNIAINIATTNGNTYTVQV